MGRRGNRNNKDRGKVGNALARKKFKREVCPKCGLCDVSTNMRLCYNRLYLNDPAVFMSVILPALIEHRAELEEVKKSKIPANIKDTQIFKKVFCDADICKHCNGTTLRAVEVCFMSFLSQTKPTTCTMIKAAKKIPASPPVMSTIISDNDDFEKEILRILEEYNRKERSTAEPIIEDHNKQYDKDNESEYIAKGASS